MAFVSLKIFFSFVIGLFYNDRSKYLNRELLWQRSKETITDTPSAFCCDVCELKYCVQA